MIKKRESKKIMTGREEFFSALFRKKWIICLIMSLLLTACTTDINGENKNDLTNTSEEVQDLLENFEKVSVERVVDGDTIKLSTGEKVRLILVNCPESVHADESKNTEFGKIASDYTKGILEGQTVYLEKDVSETDQYGRLLRYVYLEDGTFFNEQLVKEGYAQVATFPPDIKYLDLLQEAERYAREHELGLWEGTDYISEEDALYVGSLNSNKYHTLDCVYGQSIKDKNKVYFRSKKEAEAAGYSPCSQCGD